MADSLVRREARRRRILENSENRLQRISGISKLDNAADLPVKENVSVPATVGISDTVEPEDSCQEKYSSGVPSGDGPEEKKQLEDSSLHSDPSPRPSQAVVKEAEEPLSTTILAARLHLVGLAVLVRLLLSFNYGYLFGESIFVPLFTVQLMKYFGIISDTNITGAGISGVLNAALILSGIPAQRIALFTKTLAAGKSFLEDLYIFFFVFIIVHVLMEFL